MLSFSLLVLCLNIDALSYGIANGAKVNKFSIKYILCISIISTIMFAVPLAISKYVFKYFDEQVCNIINGIVLIILGINYFLPKNIFKIKSKKNIKNKEKNQSKANYSQNISDSVQEEQESEYLTFNIKLKNKEKKPRKNLFKSFCECLVISVDAIFAAFLSNFNGNYYIFFVILYAVSNFLAILLGNRLLYKISTKSRFKLDFISGFIFLLLGMLKIIGI